MTHFDIIGDIHGCWDEFVALVNKLGYEWQQELPIHPEGRKLAFVGDLADRGPQNLRVISTVAKLLHIKAAVYVPGNHCNKFYRFLLGRKVQETHGLETTTAEWRALSSVEQQQFSSLFIHMYESAPMYAVLDTGKLVIAHAGIKRKLIGKHSERVKTFVLYGDISGDTDESGRPIRRDWAAIETNQTPIIVYGHTPVKSVRHINGTYNIDTGCVFGHALTCLRYPEMEIISVPSSMPFLPEKFTTFPNQ